MSGPQAVITAHAQVMNFAEVWRGKLERSKKKVAFEPPPMSVAPGSAAPAASSGRRTRARGVRATPYSTSGRRRNAEVAPSTDFLWDFTPTTNQIEFMKDTVGKTWYLHHVSPLWRLSTTPSALTTHSHSLSSLLSQVSKTPNELKVSVKVVKSIGLDGSDGLKITVTNKVRNKDVVVLEAFLCRLGRVDSVQCGFTSLPLLLSRGPQTLSSQLHLWLQSSFDCHVSPHTLDPHDLSLLVGQFATAEKTSGRGLGGVQLVYKTTPTVAQQGLSTVSVALLYSSVVAAWERAGDTDNTRRTGFVEVLEQHVKRQLGLKLQTMSMLRVSTPVLHAEATGRIKFTTEEPIIQVLSVLQSRHF